MRNFHSISFFIGAFLIMLGAAFFAEEIWHIDIPVFKLALGFGLIVLGLRMISKKECDHFNTAEAHVIFNDSSFDSNYILPNYSVVFGSGHVDLSNLPAGENKVVEIKCVFGEFRVRINPKANVQIISKSAFGSIDFPDLTLYSFGDHMWRSTAYDPSQPTLTIRAEVVFGAIKIASYI
jgi:predicted membrane protein